MARRSSLIVLRLQLCPKMSTRQQDVKGISKFFISIHVSKKSKTPISLRETHICACMILEQAQQQINSCEGAFAPTRRRASPTVTGPWSRCTSTCFRSRRRAPTTPIASLRPPVAGNGVVAAGDAAAGTLRSAQRLKDHVVQHVSRAINS